MMQRPEITVNIIFMLLCAALALVCAHTPKAHGEIYYRWQVRWKCDTYTCYRVRYRHAYRRDEDEGWEFRDQRLETGTHCRGDLIRVVGSEHLTEDGAMNAATRQWQATARYDFGEKFMDLANARGMRWRCDRSGTNESIAGRVSETVTSGGGFLKRCVIQARPCELGTRPREREEDRDERR